MMVLQQNFGHFSNELTPVLLGVYDSSEKFDIMGVTYRGIMCAIRALYTANYFRKTGGPQNEKHPDRDMQNYLKIGKYPVTVHNTKVKQMTPVGNTYISYTQTSLKRNFCHKKCFLFVNLFTPSFNRSHQEADT